MAAKIERQKTFPYEYKSKMRDVGNWTATLTFLRRTGKIQQDIDATKCSLLNGRQSVDDAVEFRARVNATLMCAVHRGDPDDSSWVGDILDPNISYDIYLKFEEYQASFYGEGPDASKEAVSG